MARPSTLSGVRLLAAGALTHRASRRPLVQGPSQRLSAWCSLQGLADDHDALEEACFADESGAALHPGGLRDDWHQIIGLGAEDTPVLVYLHRGHQPDTRSPILQHLLRTIDHRGPAHALRVENRRALRDALVLARGFASRTGLCLVLSDPTERLAPRGLAAAPLRYLLLGDALRAARFDRSAAHAAAADADLVLQESH